MDLINGQPENKIAISSARIREWIFPPDSCYVLSHSNFIFLISYLVTYALN